MALANSTSSPRDHVADANPDVARKKQRLSEDPGSSPGDSIIIEVGEPEDIGANTENAIEIDDDIGVAMEPYSTDFFILSPERSPYEQLGRLITQIQSDFFIDEEVFINFAGALVQHIHRTTDDFHNWQQQYLDEEAEFFNRVAMVSLGLLEAGQLFEHYSDVDVPTLRQGFQALLGGLRVLCSRIIPFLPGAIKTILSRRDSMQVSTRQQSLGSLWYVLIASRISSPGLLTLDYYHKCDRRLKIPALVTDFRVQLAEAGVISSLAATIRALSGAMREVKDSWLILQHLVNLFSVLMREPQILEQYPSGKVEEVLDVVKSCILPGICEKHPRALLESFHEELVEFGCQALSVLAHFHDQASAIQLYDRFLKSNSDAMIPESAENESTATSLWRISGESREVLALLLRTSWSMQAAKAFIRSDIMDIRSVGITSLKNQLVTLYQSQKSAPEGFEHPLVQYAVRFLRENEITAYIFGPESRAGLVSHSGDIVCFLAATSTYTDAETDIIWRACSTSVEADFVKASFGVLEIIMGHLDFGNLLFLAKKYSATPVTRLGADAVRFLPRLFKQLEEKCLFLSDRAERLRLAITSVEILKHANASERCASTHYLRHSSLAEMKRYASPAFQLDDRVDIYNHCIPEIQGRTEHATTAFEVLSIFLGVLVSSAETQHILAMLPASAAVEELCNFVDTKKQHPFTQYDTEAVIVRLSCITRLMTLGPETQDKNTQERLFACAFGESALCNEARNEAWEKLNEMATTNGPPSAASGLWQSYVQDYVPSLPSNLATPRLIEFVCAVLKAEFAYEHMMADISQLLKLPLWNTLVRFATTSIPDEVVNPAQTAILDLLFMYPVTTTIPPASVAHCHSNFARDHIRDLCVEYDGCVRSKEAADWRKFNHGMNLLNAVLVKSREILSTYALAKQDDALVLGDLEGVPDRIAFLAQVHRPTRQPTSITVHARESTKISELLAEFPESIGTEENRIIAGGIDITEKPDESFSEAGIRCSGMIMLCPKYTFDVDLDKVLISPGPVEHEILLQYSSLECFLDGPENAAYRVSSHLNSLLCQSLLY